MRIIRDVNPIKLCTLGLPTLIVRNSILALAFAPRVVGNESLATDAVAITAAVALSHPLEVARVLIVNAGSTSSSILGDPVSTLRSVYQNEGVAGMYRGLTPRLAFLLPCMLTLAETCFTGDSSLFANQRNQSWEAYSGNAVQPIV